MARYWNQNTQRYEESLQVDEPQHSWWRPLFNRHARGTVNDGGRIRLIGLEIRITDPFGMREEVMMVPLNIEIIGTANAGMQHHFGNCTLHTSVGDVNIPSVPIPASGF